MKKTHIKTLALLLALAMALTMLAGCSGQSEKPGNGGDTPSGSAGGSNFDDTKPNDGEPAPGPEPELPTLGREYAGEADPAAAIAEKAAEILEGLSEGTLPAWDDKSVTGGDPADTEFKYAYIRYYKEGSNVFDLRVTWSVEDSSVREISMNIFSCDGMDTGAVQAAVLSDALMEGAGELMESLHAQESWKTVGETVAYCADGLVLREYGSAGIYQFSLRDAGHHLQKDGYVLYYTDGGEATVCGLVEGDGLPQNLIIPETLGGCPVKTVDFNFVIAESVNNGQRAIAIPKTAETVVMTQAFPAIFILPETVRTLSFPTAVPIQTSAPTIMCTGRETKLEAGRFIEGVVSNTGRKPAVQAFFGSELAEYAREHGWDLSYLDAIEGDREAAKAYLSTLLADRLAKLAADSPEDAAELEANVTFDELLDLVMENWDDAMEDEGPQGTEAKEQLEKLKAGDYSVLEDAWKSSSK